MGFLKLVLADLELMKKCVNRNQFVECLNLGQSLAHVYVDVQLVGHRYDLHNVHSYRYC